MGAAACDRISYLTDRNALFTTFKNYHDDRMGVMLLIAAALTFLRGCSSAGALHDRGRPFLSSIAIAHMLALADLSAHLPGLRRRREQVQATRRRSDEEILPLFGAFASPPAYLGEGSRGGQRLVRGGGITDRDPGDRSHPRSTPRLARSPSCSPRPAPGTSGKPTRAGASCRRDGSRTWEHEIGPLAARVLSDVRWALTGFAATRITAESLHALREVLEYAGQEGAVPVLPAPALRSFGETVATAGGPERFAVSVVIRTKDRPDSLGRALRSVAAQTLLPAEVVVVNDGGADPSPVLAGFSDRFPVALVGFPASIGRSRAAQAGLEAATGTHVLFLDDDDDLRAEHLRTLADAIADEGVRAAYTDVECVAEEKDGTGATRTVAEGILGGPLDPSRLLFENTIPIMAVLVDRSLALEVGGFDPGLTYFEDWDLWLRLARRTRIHHCPVTTATYHLGSADQGGGLTGNHRWPHLARIFDKHKEHITGRDWAHFYRSEVEATLRATDGSSTRAWRPRPPRASLPRGSAWS